MRIAPSAVSREACRTTIILHIDHLASSRALPVYGNISLCEIFSVFEAYIPAGRFRVKRKCNRK
jgi:hypothetical protein